MNTTKISAAALAFLGCILAANYVTSAYGMIQVAPGVVAAAGTWFAGGTFVLRDYLHDRLGYRWVLVLIVAGAALSLALSAPAIAVASGVAFVLSETADLIVYAPLRRRGYVRAAIASNFVGSLVDTVVFLTIAGFPVLASLPGQMIGKLTITLLVLLTVAAIRSRARVTA